MSPFVYQFILRSAKNILSSTGIPSSHPSHPSDHPPSTPVNHLEHFPSSITQTIPYHIIHLPPFPSSTLANTTPLSTSDRHPSKYAIHLPSTPRRRFPYLPNHSHSFPIPLNAASHYIPYIHTYIHTYIHKRNCVTVRSSVFPPAPLIFSVGSYLPPNSIIKKRNREH